MAAPMVAMASRTALPWFPPRERAMANPTENTMIPRKFVPVLETRVRVWTKVELAHEQLVDDITILFKTAQVELSWRVRLQPTAQLAKLTTYSVLY